MSNPTWPASLPDHFLAQGLQEALGDDVLRNQPEIGPPKTRPRSTQSWSTWTGTVRMTDAQSTAFLAFWENELIRGALPFDWVVPGTADAVTFLLMDAPQRKPDQRGVFWNWKLSLRVMP